MKNLQLKVYIFCAETGYFWKKKCEADIFYAEANVWLLLETFQCFLMNVQLPLKDISDCFWKDIKKKYAAAIPRIMST